MKFDIFARTAIGHVRTQNEDAYGFWTPEEGDTESLTRVVLAVADGMGGHPGGEIASQIAVETTLELAQQWREGTPHDLLSRIFAAGAEKIAQRGEEEPTYREMGTTLSVVIIHDDRAYIGHIGDSRVFWIRGSRWVQITCDHTVAQELVDAGKMDPEQAEDHPMSNVLTRCLGVCPVQDPDILSSSLAFEAGDSLLLASDGLAKTVHSTAVPELLNDLESEKASEQLIQAALSGGAPDNVTVVLARILGASENPPEDVHTFDPEAAFAWR